MYYWHGVSLKVMEQYSGHLPQTRQGQVDTGLDVEQRCYCEEVRARPLSRSYDKTIIQNMTDDS